MVERNLKLRKFRYFLLDPKTTYPILMKLLRRELKQAEKVRLGNPFLGEDLGIPIKDIIYGLPIRWWFHCFVNGGPQWDFLKWREYLLSWEETGLELFILHLHNKNPLDKTFLPRTIKILKAHNANTLVGFIPFYLKRLKEYKEVLRENGL